MLIETEISNLKELELPLLSKCTRTSLELGFCISSSSELTSVKRVENMKRVSLKAAGNSLVMRTTSN